MCTEKCFGPTRTAAVTRRAALVGGAAVAASAALGAPAKAGERAPAFSGKRHGLRDLTYPLTTTFPAFVPGEEAVRRTVVTIENDGTTCRSGASSSTSGPTSTRPGTSPWAAAWRPSWSRQS